MAKDSLPKWLVRRGGRIHYVRRVPARFSNLDRRDFVTVSCETDDVGRAFLPVGRAWQDALASLGIEGTHLHEDRLACGPLGGTVCFAGRGPGEVLLGEAKVVGISQRRTRAGARFQCAVPVRWDPAPLAALLRDRPDPEALAGVGAGIGESISVDQLVDALVTALG